MKILQLITQNQLRGAEVFAAQLSDMLAARGHEVVLASLLGGEQVLSTRPEVRQVALGGGSERGRGPISLRTWRSLRRLVREFEPDIVQANGSDTLKYTALLRLREWKRPVVYRNVSVMSMWAGSGVKKRLVGCALKRMSHVISVTHVGVGDLVRGFGLAPEHVSAIPIGVSVPSEAAEEDQRAMRMEVRQEFDLAPDCLLVLHIGSFSPEKNHQDLIEAFQQVAEDESKAHLLLVGDGALRAQTQATVNRLGLAERVTFAGVVPHAARLMVAADVLVLCSLREGLPGVILEAAAAGVPAVAYDVGGVSELVENGQTGVLVAKGDILGMAAGVTVMLEDSGLRRSYGDRARSSVASLYCLEDVCGRFEELYEGLVGSHAETRTRAKH